jgi:hypothetical protein
MKFKQIVKEICKREGLKKEVNVAQVTEILSRLADILYEDRRVLKNHCSFWSLFEIAEKKAKKKK